MATTTQGGPDAGTHDGPLVERRFTIAGEDPFDTVEWSKRDAWPHDSPYHMKDVEAPVSWSQQAVDITAKLYLSKGAEPETSIRQLIDRVVNRITVEGIIAGYFGHANVSAEISARSLPIDIMCFSLDDEARVFYEELVYICLHQLATFNSPVWFNIGRPDRPQCPSACYILSVDDNTESILRWAHDEAFIFKAGSGSGANVSNIRGSMETLSTGGVASGPVSYMRVPNAVAETIKSGGTTRRAARIVQLDVDHPDIVDFIRCKVREEERMMMLAEAGVNISMDREGERNVAETTSYQSANNSVRASDEFMRRATDPDEMLSWQLNPRGGGDGESVNASWLLDEMASAAHACADPGIMFDDTINAWNTTPNAGRIRSTNPCGELHTPDVSSCNLGSLNIVALLDDRNELRCDDACHVIDVMTTAMDVLVEFCELPTDLLTERTKRYRWLGLGCSNMGAAIMSKGLAYDSDEGRDFAASVMSLITGRCYRRSAELARVVGQFEGYDGNQQAMDEVIDKHRKHLPSPAYQGGALWSAASVAWLDARRGGQQHGYRNAQASVIAPGGTTSFFMDCDTTGIEPSFSLVQHKTLSGGGSMVLVNQSVGRALQSLGYTIDDAIDMTEALRLGGVDDFMNLLEPEHRDVFDGANDISAMGHIKMLAAVQPWISGASSKTCNLSSSATPSDIRECFISAWKLGVKCIAVYRDGSKARQVLSTAPKKEIVDDTGDIDDQIRQIEGPRRRRLPRTRRNCVTHKIHIRSALGADHEGYIGAGVYPDGTLGEVFMEGFGRMGGFVQNVLSAWATDLSISLQYGVPFDVLVRKHVGHSDETGGVVVPGDDGEPLVIRSCDSIVDYIARWLVSEFGDVDLQDELGVMTGAVKARKTAAIDGALPPSYAQGGIVQPETPQKITAMIASSNGHARETVMSAQTCPACRTPMQRTGTCLRCPSCGETSGGCG